jgi:hypothetical protein
MWQSLLPVGCVFTGQGSLAEALSVLAQRRLEEPSERVFAAETPTGGREYLVCSLYMLIPHMLAQPELRTLHEIPLPKDPTQLLLDLEFMRDDYPDAPDDDALAKEVVRQVHAYAKTLPEMGPKTSISVAQADASNKKKFSRRMQILFYELSAPDDDSASASASASVPKTEIVFKNFFSMGAFVRRCFSACKDSPVWYASGTQCIVDPCYTTGHSMRMAGQHKQPKNGEPKRPFLLLKDGKPLDEETSVMFCEALMMQKFGLQGRQILLSEADGSEARSTNCSLSNYPAGLRDQSAGFLRSSGVSNLNFADTGRQVQLSLDKFVQSFGHRISPKDQPALPPWKTIFAPVQQIEDESVPRVFLEYDWKSIPLPKLALHQRIQRTIFLLTQDPTTRVKHEFENEKGDIWVSVATDRTTACMIGKWKTHRSNHAKFSVDLGKGRVFQKCHKTECSGGRVEIVMPISLRFHMFFASELHKTYRLAWANSHSSTLPDVFDAYTSFKPAETQLKEPAIDIVLSSHCRPWQTQMMKLCLQHGPRDTLLQKELMKILEQLV